MRFFNGSTASVIIFLSLGFFTTVADAQQSPCDPDSESYDARVCFAYVRVLEAQNAKAKSDLAVTRRETTIAKSQLVAARVQHSKAAMNLGFDIELQERLLSGYERTIELLSEEKETAWWYVNAVLKLFATIMGLAFLAGIAGLYFFRKRISDCTRYAIKVRDARISELEDNLRQETDKKLMAFNDAAALRQELFHKKLDLSKARKRYTNILNSLRKEMSRFEAVRETLYRTLLQLQANENQLEQLSSIAPPRATV